MQALYEIDQAILDCVDAETGEILDAEKLAEKAPTPNKTAIKEYISTGGEVPHVSIVQKENIIIK